MQKLLAPTSATTIGMSPTEVDMSKTDGWTSRPSSGPKLALVLVVAAVMALSVTAAASPGTRSGSSAQATPVKVKFAIAAGLQAGALYWDIMVASAQGYFKKHGIDPQVINTTNGPITTQAIAAGSVDMAAAASDALIAGARAGADIKMVAFNTLSTQAIVTNPSIKTYKDLIGKKVAVTSLGAGSSLILFNMLKSHGINPERLNFVLSGSTPQRFAALQAGAVDATIVSVPDDQSAKEAGFHILEYSQQRFPFMFVSTWVRRSFAKEHPALVKGYVAALQEAHTWMLKPANRYRAAHILKRYTNSTQSASTIAYNTVVNQLKALPASVKPDLKTLRESLKVLNIPPGDAGKLLK
jgi:NitT/TauT family transport system substrate-binding protein